MNTINELFQKSYIKDLVKRVSRANGMIKRNLGRPLINLFDRICHSVVGTNKSWIKVYKSYALFVHKLYKKGGLKYVVIYLKACSVLLQQVVGGQRLPSTHVLGAAIARTKAGLPRVIPPLMRRRIMAREVGVIRVWLTLFNLYRVIEYPGKLNLSTITAPPKEDIPINGWYQFLVTTLTSELLRKWADVPIISALTSEAFRDRFVKTGLRAVPFLLFKTSPAISGMETWITDGRGKALQDVSTSFHGILLAANLLYHDSVLWVHYSTLAKQTYNTAFLNRMEVFSNWMDKVNQWGIPALIRVDNPILQQLWKKTLRKMGYTVHQVLRRLDRTDWLLDRIADCKIFQPIELGRLGVKHEPAGKERVYAMVDCWTQWLLWPLHKAIFAFLQRLPQDGTFDQSKPVKRLIERMEDLGLSRTFCYDLSAATDRLPISIQVVLLSLFVGEKVANAWKGLLVDRPYSLVYRPQRDQNYTTKTVYYGCGQPMGALSSWAMLALTHHFIVQWAWARVCLKQSRLYSWFELYAVLGDDIVIAHPLVAEEYLTIMKDLGVGISLAKSLVSDSKTMEFAKKFFIPEDATPIPFKELMVAERNSSVLIEFARKYNLRIPDILHLLGYGYHVRGSIHAPFSKLGRRVVLVLLSLTAPGSPWGLDLRRWLMMNSLVTTESGTEWDRLLQSFYDVEVKALHRKVEELKPLIDKANAMIFVHRDREHYGTVEPKPHSSRRLGARLFTSDSRFFKILEEDFRIADLLLEFVYRPAFLWTGDQYSKLKSQLEDLPPVNKLEDPFKQISDLWDLVNQVSQALDQIPVPRDVEHRAGDKPVKNLFIKRAKWWFKAKLYRS